MNNGKEDNKDVVLNVDARRLPGGDERYRLLFDAGQQLTSALDVTQVCQRLHQLVSRAMLCDGLIVSSYNPADDLIHCEYIYSSGQVLDASALPPIPLGPPGTGMQSEVIRSGKPKSFGDVVKRVTDPKGTFMTVGADGVVKPVEEEPPATKCALMVPVLLDGKVTGVVQVMTDTPAAYTEDDLEILEGIVLLLGAAIQNSKLFAKVNEELTERRKAEEALRESEAKFRFIAEVGPGYMWTVDPNLNLQYANRRWLQLTGLTLAQARGTGWHAIVHPEDLEDLLAAWSSAAATMAEFRFRHRIRMSDGTYRWVQSRAQPDADTAGHLREWFGLTLDITDHKQAEADLEQRVKERTEALQAANRELEGFTYSVSHDLRGPLRAIMSTSMILKEDYSANLPPDAKDQLERQARAARKMGDLIDDLLRLSRIGRQEMIRSTVDLSTMAEEIFKETKSEAEFQCQPEMTVQADPKLMRLTIQNLVDNAVKFSKNSPHPRVDFSCDTHGVFAVHDNGIGFDMAYADKLFGPFERLVRDDEYPGTGIGLANVKRIIERHGGKVWAEGEPEQGATFFFSIP